MKTSKPSIPATGASVKQSKKIGLPPGSLVHVGQKYADHVKMTVIDYNSESATETILHNPEECAAYRTKNSISWINIDGLHNLKLIESLGRDYELHPLLLEDVVNTHQRPKAEEYDNHLFVTLKMIGIHPGTQKPVSEQVSLVMGEGYVISFQEREGDVFQTIRERIMVGKGRARHRKSDYLLYILIDAIVDNYFLVMEAFTDNIIKLENEVISMSEDDQLMKKIQRYRRQVTTLRRQILPLREAVGRLEKGFSDLIEDETTKYFRDINDHVLQLNDTLESNRDILTTILEIQLSHAGNKMNQIMKVLTVISTIFIPLTFIAGIYGMNFQVMPELNWKYGYFTVWGVMIIVTLVMIRFFRKKKWF